MSEMAPERLLAAAHLDSLKRGVTGKRICCGMYIPSQVKPLLTPSGFARQVYDLFLDA